MAQRGFKAGSEIEVAVGFYTATKPIKEGELVTIYNAGVRPYVPRFMYVNSGSGENMTTTQDVILCRLTSTRALFFAMDGSNRSVIIRIITILANGGIQVTGTQTLLSSATDAFRATRLDDNRVVISYYDNAATTSKLCVVRAVGTTITKGTDVVLMSGLGWPNLATIDENKVILVNRSGSTLNARIIDISDMTITVRTAYSLSLTAASNYPQIIVFNPTQVGVIYTNQEQSHRGEAVLLTINDYVITFGTPLIFQSTSPGNTSATRITDNKALALYSIYQNPVYQSRASIIEFNLITGAVSKKIEVAPSLESHFSISSATGFYCDMLKNSNGVLLVTGGSSIIADVDAQNDIISFGDQRFVNWATVAVPNFGLNSVATGFSFVSMGGARYLAAASRTNFNSFITTMLEQDPPQGIAMNGGQVGDLIEVKELFRKD